MKKTNAVLASLFVIAALSVRGADYPVNVTLEQPTTTTVTSAVHVATATVTSINVIGLDKEFPKYAIRILLKDVEGKLIANKTAILTQEQLKVYMPTIDQIIAGGRASMSNNISSILAVAK